MESIEKLADSETVAVILEPLQAEGGIHLADPKFLEGLRTLCDEMKMLLIYWNHIIFQNDIYKWYLHRGRQNA